MHDVPMAAYCIAEPSINYAQLAEFTESIGAEAWFDKVFNDCMSNESPSDAEILAEFAGRLCYRSYLPGLNENVTKIREDRGEYLTNVLRSGHGSVLEHCNYTFVLTGISRTCTHELVRHRAGVAFSQESLRYVRLTDVPFRHADCVQGDSELEALADASVEASEKLIARIIEKSDLGSADFHVKKTVTSDARRYAPMGTLTSICMTANVRALRHMIVLRTSEGAMEEIRQLFGLIAEQLIEKSPLLFGDLVKQEVTGRASAYLTEFRKV